jgi:hypothetical protein
MAAVKYIRYEQDLDKAKSMGRRPWTGLDGLVLALAAVCFILLVNGAGDDQGGIENQGGDDDDDDGTNNQQGGGGGSRDRREKTRRLLRLIPSAVIVFVLGVAFAAPGGGAGAARGPVKGAVPQIPLSVLNSVVAVCKLTRDLFPEKAASVSMSMGAMNLVGCWFGTMPCCHGAGGLAGQ